MTTPTHIPVTKELLALLVDYAAANEKYRQAMKDGDSRSYLSGAMLAWNMADLHAHDIARAVQKLVEEERLATTN